MNKKQIKNIIDFTLIKKQIEKTSRVLVTKYCDLNYVYINNNSQTTVIFFHGFNGSKTDMLQWMLHATEYNFLSFNMPGYRNSSLNEKNPKTFNLNDYLISILELINKVVTSQDIVLLGHSLGCFIAAKLSSVMKKKHKVILISPVTEKLFTEWNYSLNILLMKNVKSVNSLSKIITAKPVKINWLLKPFIYLKIVLMYKKNQKINSLIFKSLEKYFIEKEFQKSYRKITATRALICGTQDKIIKFEWMQQVKKDLRVNKIYTIPEAGHLPYIEQFVFFCKTMNEIMADFNNNKL